MSIFADGMILYIRGSQNSTRQLLEMNLQFQQIGEIQHHLQNSIVFLYTFKYIVKETMDTIPYIKASTRIKYFGINLTKEVKDVYNETYNV